MAYYKATHLYGGTKDNSTYSILHQSVGWCNSYWVIVTIILAAEPLTT
jgi:hypothetical protein